MKVSLVIPNYNGKKLLQKNLTTIIIAAKGAEVIVVDDGSNDESSAYLKQSFPSLKLIEKMTNDGFATSVNLGVKASHGDIIVLLNTDSSPHDDFLKPLVEHFSNPNIFAVGCLDESIEEDQIIKRGRGIGKFQNGFLIHQRGEINKVDTLWASGGSSAYRKEIWEKLGGMDEIYNPFYWEDIDLSYRAQKSGYKVLFEPKSIVIHRHSEGSIKSYYSKDQIATIAYRNQLIFIWKNITDKILLLNHLIWLPYYLIKAILNKDIAFLSGFKNALFKLPEIWTKRKWQIKSFIIKDKEILNIFFE